MKRYYFYSETQLIDVLEGDITSPEFKALVDRFTARKEVVSVDFDYLKPEAN